MSDRYTFFSVFWYPYLAWNRLGNLEGYLGSNHHKGGLLRGNFRRLCRRWLWNWIMWLSESWRRRWQSLRLHVCIGIGSASETLISSPPLDCSMKHGQWQCIQKALGWINFSIEVRMWHNYWLLLFVNCGLRGILMMLAVGGWRLLWQVLRKK